MKLFKTKNKYYTKKEIETVENFIKKFNKREGEKLKKYIAGKEPLSKDLKSYLEKIIETTGYMQIIINEIKKEMEKNEKNNNNNR